MASSKGSPGPHDRKAFSAPREKCIKVGAYTGKLCKNNRSVGSKLCWRHKAEAQAAGANAARAIEGKRLQKEKVKSTFGSIALKGTDLPTGRQRQTASDLVITAQARAALQRLGNPLGRNETVDPKRALLDAVRSSHEQMTVWEQMLANIPPEDWQYVGMPAIPGSPSSAKGARIEIIQKNLDLATKNASRVAKLALDAGIEERLVRLAEDQAAMIADTVKAAVIAAIGSLGLTPAKEAAAVLTALGAGAQQLRLLASGPSAQSTGEAEIIDQVAVHVRESPL